jgi:hypothetical protein
MYRKLFTLRQAVIGAAALAAGTIASAAVDAVHQVGPYPGRIAATITALWVMVKLDQLIDDTE